MHSTTRLEHYEKTLKVQCYLSLNLISNLSEDLAPILALTIVQSSLIFSNDIYFSKWQIIKFSITFLILTRFIRNGGKIFFHIYSFQPCHGTWQTV